MTHFLPSSLFQSIVVLCLLGILAVRNFWVEKSGSRIR